MTSVLYTISKYLIIVLFAYFVYVSFGAQRDFSSENAKKKFNSQRTLMIFIHFLAFLSIAVKIFQGKATDATLIQLSAFYFGQLIYIVIIACILPRIIPLSRGMNNCMLMFICIGLIMQTRLGFSSAVRQFFMIVLGTVLYIAFSVIIKKVDFARNLKWVYCIAGVALLILVLILSTASKGAKTYLDLGFITFQPLEFVKILFVLFVAAFFYKDKSYKTVIITAVFAAAHVLILVACNDLGGALILAVIYVIMVYVAKKDWKILAIGFLGFVCAALLAYKLFSHVQVRVEAWLDPFSDIAGNGYQIAQSLFAIGTGGWFGLGIYSGSPKSIPEVSNDMIFSAICEELGVFFGIMLILLWLCFILMIVRISLRVSNIFYKLVCFGCAMIFCVQIFLNIGGAVGFIPLTGVNLPFISSGGSSMFASMIMTGMVQALYVISEIDVEIEKEAAMQASLSKPEGRRAAGKQKVRQVSAEDEPYPYKKTKDRNEGNGFYGSDDIFPEETDYETQIAHKVRQIESDNIYSEDKDRTKKVRRIDPEDL